MTTLQHGRRRQPLVGLFVLLLLVASPLARAQESSRDPSANDGQSAQLTAEQASYLAWARQLWESLDRRHGAVKLPNGVATLQVPDSFYYLSPADAEKVLVEVWGNPPGAGSETLGLLMAEQHTPFDAESWAVTIEYEADGHVSDEDADSIDYDELLSQLKQSTRAANKERLDQGYDSIELVGWAAPPYYDKGSHKLHWAQELRFGDKAKHTLNYNIRVLGRQGVLVLNFIADMDQQAEIERNLGTVLAMAEFDQGSRYEDFDPSLDKVAAYGIGALVAGKMAAKTGLLAVAIVFLKKFGVVIVAGLAALGFRLLKRKRG